MAGAFWGGTHLTQSAECGAYCGRLTQTLNVNEFSKLVDQGDGIVLDVRTGQEYAGGHIATAINADFSDTAEFDKYLAGLDKNGKYLLYCRTGNRSGQAMKMMEEKGFTDIADLSGGILAWQTANLEVVK